MYGKLGSEHSCSWQRTKVFLNKLDLENFCPLLTSQQTICNTDTMCIFVTLPSYFPEFSYRITSSPSSQEAKVIVWHCTLLKCNFGIIIQNAAQYTLPPLYSVLIWSLKGIHSSRVYVQCMMISQDKMLSSRQTSHEYRKLVHSPNSTQSNNMHTSTGTDHLSSFNKFSSVKKKIEMNPNFTRRLFSLLHYSKLSPSLIHFPFRIKSRLILVENRKGRRISSGRKW